MKDKLLQIRVDTEFIIALENLQKVKGYSSISDTVREIIRESIADQESKSANCNRCIHKNVCFNFWQSDIVTCEDERNVDSMSDSWSCDCENYKTSTI